MPLQFSTTLRDAQANNIESVVGTAPRLQFRTGAPPANCAAADTGTLLAELLLPTDWLTAASAGTVALLGTWTGTAVAAGTAGHFRVKNNAGTVTHIQGTVTATGGGGDLTLDNTSIANGQQVDQITFSVTRGNA